jgi:hypothetical protein
MAKLDVALENLNTSVNVDSFDIQDNVLNSLIASFRLRGGDQFPFQAEDDGSGNGDVTVINTGTGAATHFSFVKDGDVLKI